MTATSNTDSDSMTTARKPVIELTDDELHHEWEVFMWAESVGEFKFTDEQVERHREIEHEIGRRPARPEDA